VATFGATTPELEKMAAWLKERKVETIALESTGVYWIAPHEVLERHGFDLTLVNTRELARVPGRKKTDRIDCKWIQRLHSCGLLSGSFRPAEAVCILRTLVRDKTTLTAEASDWLRRMQKSLDQMNVRVHRAVSDIDGVTGMAIIKAIVAGERDPRKLARLRDGRCHKSEEEISEQLSGHWREDHLFSLKQALKMYEAIQQRIAEYESELLRKMAEMEREETRGQEPPALSNLRKGRQILADILSEYGPDLSRFPDEKHFVSHLTLAPRQAISGGKAVTKKKKKGTASTRVAAALRMAALCLRNSKTALGAYYRQISRRLGGDVAVFATARKLAIVIYRLLRWGQPYVDQGAANYEKQYRQRRLSNLKTAAQDLGYALIPKIAEA
jgi:transposase